MYKPDFNSLLNSVEWVEALRDLDINSAWTYVSSKFNRESIPMSVQKREKNLYITREAIQIFEEQKKPLWERSQFHSDHLAYIHACNALGTLTLNLRDQFENIKENPKIFLELCKEQNENASHD